MNSSTTRRVVLPAVGVIPLALAVACSNSGDEAVKSTSPTPNSSAGSGSSQTTTPKLPGTSAPPTSAGPLVHPDKPTPSTSQPGVAPSGSDSLVAPRSTRMQPGISTTPPPAPPVPSVSPKADYAVPPNFRPIPKQSKPAPGVNWQKLHAPEPVEPVAPIAPPPRTVRVGDFSTPAPNEVPDDMLNTFNNGVAQGEANIATGLNSVGIEGNRSDKVAGGAVAGAALGATAAGVPAAVVGAVPGAIVGGVVGGAIDATVSAPTVAGIPTGIATGAAIGAGVGAAAGGAALGIPAAVAGGVAGGAVGAAVGSGVDSAPVANDDNPGAAPEQQQPGTPAVDAGAPQADGAAEAA